MGLVRNDGTLPAKNVVVNMYLKQPLSQTIQTTDCGASSDALGIDDLLAPPRLIKTETFPEILPGQIASIAGWESGLLREPLEIIVEIEPVEGELNLDNNQARETYTVFTSGANDTVDTAAMSVFLSTNCARNVEYFAMEVPGPDGSKCEAYDLSISPASGSLAPGETVNFNLSSAPSSTANPGDACDAKFSVFMPLYDGTSIPVVSFWFFDRIVSPATLTCSAPAGSSAPGVPVTITGALDPGLAQTIALSYTDPTGLVKTRTLLTNAEGIYSDQFTPGLTGQWIVTAAWAGDETHASTLSAQCLFKVENLVVTPVTVVLPPTFKATVSANCRQGPSLFYRSLGLTTISSDYPLAGLLDVGGWYFIQFNESHKCWVAASTGQTSGDLSGLERFHVDIITPTPPLLPPVDIITPTPIIVDYCNQFTSFGICQIAHSDKCIWDAPAGICKSK